MGLLLATAPARADYRQDYLDGRAALRAGDLEAAARALRAAIAEQPTERARARLVGMIPEPYLPHHYLGLAHFAARRCPEALTELRISAGQGALATLAQQRSESERRRAQCESLAAAQQAVATARTTLSHAPPASVPPAATSLATAERTLTAGIAAWDFETIARAEDQARRAAAELEAWLASERLAASRPSPTTATQEPESPAAAPIPSEGETIVTPPASATPPPAVNAPAGAEAPPPAMLVTAVQSYFDGDYQSCVTALRALTTAPGTRARFFQSLFRGAGLHALYLLNGARDADLLIEAREDLRAAQRADPRFTPSSADFSPRLVELYRGLH